MGKKHRNRITGQKRTIIYLKKISLQLKKHTGKNIPLPNASLKLQKTADFRSFLFVMLFVQSDG